METIEIDNDIFTHLEKHARPFVDTPNSTLRRLLGLDRTTTPIATQKKSLSLVSGEVGKPPVEYLLTSSRAKAPKANLAVLLQENFLRNSQKVYLVDYQRNRILEFVALVSGCDLIYNSQRYSMSNLAQKLLTEVGFKSNSVRGPAHWVTDEGKSIKDLWRQHLERNARK